MGVLKRWRRPTPPDLVEGDHLFERACHHAAIGVCLVAPDGRFLRVNPALCRILGRTEQELLATDFASVTHPDNLDGSRLLHWELTSGDRETASLEKRYLTGDARVTWALTTVSAVRDPDTGAARVLIAQIQDITARKEAERQLRESREEFRLLAETSTDVVSRHAPTGAYLYVSPAVRHLLGHEPEELLGRSLFDLVHPGDLPELERCHRALLTGGASFTSTFRMRRSNGAWGWFETSFRRVCIQGDGDADRPQRTELHASSRDVTGRKRNEERIRDLARRLEEANRHLQQANLSLEEIAATDPLTGLGNRRDFERRLEVELRRCCRSAGPLSLLYLDLDRFKSYNDRYGHLAGDELLIKLGALLADSVRTSDSVCRIGGEEFVVLLPETAEEGAATLGEKLRQVVAERLAGRRPVTLSVGAATIHPRRSSSLDLKRLVADLLQTADSALYRAKHAGRNRVVHSVVGRESTSGG